MLEILVLLLPLGLFLSLAYAGETERPIAALVYVVLVLFDALLLFVGSAFSLVFVMERLPSGMPVSGLEPFPGFSVIGPIYLTMGILGLMLLYPPFRKPIAAVTYIDPDRLVHAVALHYAILLVVASALIGVAMPGIVADPEMLEGIQREVESGGLTAVWLQNIGLLIVSLLGVGLFIRRSFRESLERLGIEPRVDIKYVIVVPLLGLASGLVVDFIWSALSPGNIEGVERISEALFDPYVQRGVLGALTIGLAAGIGEEALFRGAAQPKLGIALTALLFAVLHMQYTLSLALVQVFTVGLLFGITRFRSNTTTAMLCHALYNFILVMLAINQVDI